jgi:NADH-quinone oxidoreductase subunit G
MDIHSVSEVNDPSIDLSLINGPATSDVYNPSTKQA